MASFHTKTFTKHNDYMTPNYAWDNIIDYIPKDKVIWEAFYGDGKSGEYLKSLGLNVIHEDIDFFKNDLGEVIVTNPPYQYCKKILKRLVELEKPFILIMPCSKITTQYFRKLFSNNDDKIQIIIPKKRIHFLKLVDGKRVEGWGDRCYFDCFYYCWKMNLPNDIVWL